MIRKEIEQLLESKELLVDNNEYTVKGKKFVIRTKDNAHYIGHKLKLLKDFILFEGNVFTYITYARINEFSIEKVE